MIVDSINVAEGQVTDTSAEREGKRYVNDLSHTGVVPFCSIPSVLSISLTSIISTSPNAFICSWNHSHLSSGTFTVIIFILSCFCFLITN